MHIDYTTRFVADWKQGVGEYLVITVNLNHDECDPAKVVAGTAAAVSGVTEWLRQRGTASTIVAVIVDLVAGMIARDAKAISKADRGSGAIAVWELPLLGAGVAHFSVTSKFAEVISDVFESTFSDIWVDVSDEARDASETEDGWRRILVDLNRGAHGKYLYFIIKPDAADCVSDITLGANKKRQNIPTPEGYTKIDVDLNLGCGKGTDYIYSFFRKEGAPLRGFGVVAGPERDLPMPDGYERIDFDLNRGAHGNFIYICIRR